ncbi:MAG: cation:proton antiporter [Bacteroidales bacterium]|nr:cation:proton antiporter [Bacteroidales bacterium]
MIEAIQHEFQRPFGNPVLVFSIILLVILLSPIVLKKLRIPGIIGLIISGVVIGPHALNLIEKNSAVDLFSTIGLLYIMFIAGLELDLNEFRKNRNKSLVFGTLTFILPLFIGFLVCFYLLEFDIWASLLTASMFSTHTLVAYPIVSKLGVAKNRAVAITVGGTILTDTAVLLMLAVIMNSSEGTIGPAFWVSLLLSLLVFTVVMFYVIPKLSSWFFSKLESERHSHYIFVLLIVFVAAFMAELAGVEPIIGAFVSGLVLNRLIPHTSVLMNRIEFIGNSLFIPFFLISVGMLVDLSVLVKGPMALIIAGTLTAVALLGKWMAAIATRMIYRFTRDEGNLIFGLSSSHAAATLAVILVGYKAGLLDENILNGTIILILVTCVVASFVTEKSGKAIALSNESGLLAQIGEHQHQKEQILMPVANMQNFTKLLEFSMMISARQMNQPIMVLSVVPNNEEAETNILKARNMLKTIAQEALASETLVNIMATIDHNASSGIARTSREIGASTIIMGWPQRQGIIGKLIGDGLDSIVQNTNKTTFFCHFVKPIANHKRLLIMVPPMAEMEQGFSQWVTKMNTLAVELSASLLYYCAPLSQQSINQCIDKLKLSASVHFKSIEEWEQLIKKESEQSADDILVMVSSRKGAVSYSNQLDNLADRIEKRFSANSRIILFPEQHKVDYVNDRYKELDGEPLARGIETVQRIGKGVSSFFRKTE